MLLIFDLDIVILLIASTGLFGQFSMYRFLQQSFFVLIVSFRSEDGLIISYGFMVGIMFFDLVDCSLHEVVVLFRMSWLLFYEACFEHQKLGTD